MIIVNSCIPSVASDLRSSGELSIVPVPCTVDADAFLLSCRCFPLYSADALLELSQAFPLPLPGITFN